MINRGTLFIIELLTVFKVPKWIAKKHLEQNTIQWEYHTKQMMKCGQMSEKSLNGRLYLEEQCSMGLYAYGMNIRLFDCLFFKGRKISVRENGCEIIALFNALNCMKDTVSFPELLYQFERKGISLFGYFGTSIYAVAAYLKQNGYEVATCVFPGRKRFPSGKKRSGNTIERGIDSAKAYIAVVFNNRHNILEAVHTMCITRQDNGYVLHNDYEGSRIYGSVEAALAGYHNGMAGTIALLSIKETETS